MTEFRIAGPAGANPANTPDTLPQFQVGSKLETVYYDGTCNMPKIYRYCRVRQACTVASVYKLLSNFEMGNALTTTIADAAPLHLGVACQSITSPTGSVYAWMQTGGFFPKLSVLTACSTHVELYSSATAGYLDDDGGSTGQRVNGLKNVDNGNAAARNVMAFSEREIMLETDSPQNEMGAT